MTETAIVNSIMRWLKAQPGCWAFKVHGGPWQLAGVPDIVGCLDGKFFALEVKRPGGKIRPVQEIIIGQIRKAGGLADIVYNKEQVCELLSNLR